MNMTPEQMVEFLVGAFGDIERDTLLLVLQANSYNLESTLETLISIESGTGPTLRESEAENRLENPSRENGNFSTASSGGTKRGAKVSLPDDFLRIPGWSARHEEQLNARDIMTLCSDPVFLRELEREFGPDYESVLREHLQAEALRMTAATVTGRDSATRPPQSHVSHTAQHQIVREEYGQSPYDRQPQLLAPSTYFSAPWQQEPPGLRHQTRGGSEGSDTDGGWAVRDPPPPSRRSPSTASISTMQGFGGGAPAPSRPVRDNTGSSISDRFQSILSSFYSKDRTREGQEARGLLQQSEEDNDDDEEEEGQWEEGVQMRQVSSSNSSSRGIEAQHPEEDGHGGEDDEERSLLRIRAVPE